VPGQVSEMTCLSMPAASMSAIRSSPRSVSREVTHAGRSAALRRKKPCRLTKPGSSMVPSASMDRHSAISSGGANASSVAMRRYSATGRLSARCRAKHHGPFGIFYSEGTGNVLDGTAALPV
jgi:hypothetical protein